MVLKLVQLASSSFGRHALSRIVKNALVIMLLVGGIVQLSAQSIIIVDDIHPREGNGHHLEQIRFEIPNDAEVSLYPNPRSERGPVYLRSSHSIQELSLVTLLGQVVSHIEPTKTQQYQITVPRTMEPLYFVRVRTEKGVHVLTLRNE